MHPEQILEAVAEAYATCSTYRDSGQVTTQFRHPEGRNPWTSVKPFTTAFHRPDRFRFEFRDRRMTKHEWKRYIVWAGGEEVRKWWDAVPGVKRPESLELALGGATGVSGGSAHTVPALLMPDRVRGRRLTELAELASLGDEPLGGVICFRLSGRFLPPPVDLAQDKGRAERDIALTGRRQRAEHFPLTVWIDCSVSEALRFRASSAALLPSGDWPRPERSLPRLKREAPVYVWHAPSRASATLSSRRSFHPTRRGTTTLPNRALLLEAKRVYL